MVHIKMNVPLGRADITKEGNKNTKAEGTKEKGY